MAAPENHPDLTGAIDAVLRRIGSSPPTRIGIAVSGGGDSMALLLAARDWAEGAGAVVLAATIDHGLRAGSAGEAGTVATSCARLGIPHRILRADGLSDGPNLQARARHYRYDLLSEWARDSRLDAVLLGHTADDVAETVLMRLKRGVGLDGLAAMRTIRVVNGIAFARPFLEIERAALRNDLRRRGVGWIEDPSNVDDRFERATIRKAMATLDLAPAMLARSGRHLDAARSALDLSMRDLALRMFREDRGDLLLPRAGLQLDRERLRRILLIALDWIGGAPVPREAEQGRLLTALPHLTAPLTLAGCLLSPLPDGTGLRIAREAGACPPPLPFAPADGDGQAAVKWDRRWRIEGTAGPDATIGALGKDIAQTPWRPTGLPRASLMASPALRSGDTLIAAPLAGLGGQVTATLVPSFAAALRHE